MTESSRITSDLDRQEQRDRVYLPRIDPAKEASGGTAICGCYRWRKDGTARVCGKKLGHEGRHGRGA